MRSLETAIIEIIYEVEGAKDAASAIMKAIRDRLLSEEAVTAAGMGLTGARWDNGLKLVSGDKLTAREMAATEARAALLAAMDRIESHDR